MEKGNTFTIAEGDFGFKFFIEKAVPEMEGDDMIITGIASTANIDHDNEKMSPEAMKDMASVINEKSVPLRLEHNKEDSAVLGKVFKAWMDNRNQLWIKAVIDKSHPAGPILYNALKSGTKMGLSVGGRVKKAVKEFSEKTGRAIKTFYNVLLDEVSITQRPANYDAWLFAKSQKQEVTAIDVILNKEKYYREFIFENQQLDYMQAFAKSIDEKAWIQVKDTAIINNLFKSMEDTKDTDAKKAEETKEKNPLKAMAKKDLKDLQETKKAEDTKDETKKEGDTKKAEDTKDETKKAEDTKDETKKAEDTKDETKKSEDTKDETKCAKKEDTKDDTKKAAKDETETATKAELDSFKSIVADGFKSMTKAMEDMKKAMDDKKTDSETNDKAMTDTKETKEKEEDTKDTKKASDTDTKDTKKASDTDTKDTKKADDTKDDTTTSEYAIKNSVKKMQEISGGVAMKKSQGEERGMTIDDLVFALSKAVIAMNDKMDKAGITIPGFEKSIVDKIKADPDMQAVFKELMAMPGFKKSVSLGVPYMVTKDGRRYSLAASEMSETIIEKSQKNDKKKSFKEVYKSDLATVTEDNEVRG